MKKLILSAGFIGAFIAYIALWENATFTPFAVATPAPSASTPAASSAGNPPVTQPGRYRNGTYVGSAEDAFYGLVQVQAVIANGALQNVEVLQYPNDRRESLQINSRAMPRLISEAISAQDANVNVVSGATDSSHAFASSLASALSQAS
jgi:uncharacterized protein with FMN-binding domain